MKPRIYFEEGSWWCKVETEGGEFVHYGWSHSPRGAYLDCLIGISFCKIEKQRGHPTLKALYHFGK
jgi:hypothetical protein